MRALWVFGNILTVTRTDLLTFAVFTLVLTGYYAVRFPVVTACAFDRDFARVSGLPVTRVTTVMTLFTAVCIVLTIRLVGVMLLMSMLTLPVMIAEMFVGRMKPLLWLSVAVSAVGCTAGLFLGAVIDVPASALIVLTLAGMWVIVRMIRFFSGQIGR